MCSHRSPRGDRKRLKEEYFPLFVLFVLFGQAKRTLKEKYHKATFLLSYFCVTKSTKSHLRGLSSLLKNSFRRLAATNANKVPRPSRYSLAAASGSKRSSADSDLLLCHVGLWRTSRELTDSRKRTRSASPRRGKREAFVALRRARNLLSAFSF